MVYVFYSCGVLWKTAGEWNPARVLTFVPSPLSFSLVFFRRDSRKMFSAIPFSRQIRNVTTRLAVRSIRFNVVTQVEHRLVHEMT